MYDDCARQWIGGPAPGAMLARAVALARVTPAAAATNRTPCVVERSPAAAPALAPKEATQLAGRKPWFWIVDDLEPDRDPTLREIVIATASHFDITENQILSFRRTWNVIRPRLLCYWLARERTKLSLPQIGAFFDRDHTTILVGARRAADLIAHGELASSARLLQSKLDAIVRA